MICWKEKEGKGVNIYMGDVKIPKFRKNKLLIVIFFQIELSIFEMNNSIGLLKPGALKIKIISFLIHLLKKSN